MMKNIQTLTSSLLQLGFVCLIAILSFPTVGTAQENNPFVIEGNVQAAFLPIPIPGVEITVYSEDGNYRDRTLTNGEGKFRVEFDLNPSDTLTFTVEVDDPCVDGTVSEEVSSTINPSMVFFKICPFDEIFCSADFEALVAPELTVQFLSIDLIGANDHSWDFGDGNVSDEASPVHHYEASGEYQVTHVLKNQDCSDTSTMIVTVDSVICGCPKYYQPVCVTDSSGNLLEFDNPCFALCEGYTIYESCRDSCTECPDTIAPVCVRTLAGEITFKNSCEAECAGFNDYQTCKSDCSCDDVFDPVCGYQDDGTPIRFDNACHAECQGYVDLQPCDSCFCPDYFAPADVCVMTEDGEMLNFSNPCEAECAGYTEYYFCDPECNCPFDFEPVCLMGPADGVELFLNQCFADCQGQEDWIPCPNCACPWIYSPVCVIDSTGESKWFANECFAECEGYTEFTECEDPCFCPEYYEPVCAIGEDGDTLEFSNPCFALCEGYGPDRTFRCDGTDECNCIGLYDPVCVINEEGDTIEFSNSCFARCEGYTGDLIFRCEPVTECVCDAVYDPVCVFTDTGVEEFSSACVAICAGYDVFFNCDRACDCPLDSEPVCVEFPFGGQIEILNACWANCLGLITVDCEGDDENAQAMGEMEVPETNIHRRTQNELLAFPNPFDESVSLRFSNFSSTGHKLIITDIVGRVVHIVNSSENTARIDTDAWSPGIYFLRGEVAGRPQVIKLIKQ